MRKMYRPLSGKCLRPSPAPQAPHHEDGAAEEIVQHGMLEGLGLGPLAIVLMGVKFQEEMAVAKDDNGRAPVVNQNPAAWNKPGRSFVPGK